MNLVEDLISIEREVSREKGDFCLFGLFLREDAQDKWDLLVSAPWTDADEEGALNYLANLLQSRLTPEELRSLSGIVLVNANNPALEAIQKAVAVEHGMVELRDSNFFGHPMNEAGLCYHIEEARKSLGARWRGPITKIGHEVSHSPLAQL